MEVFDVNGVQVGVSVCFEYNFRGESRIIDGQGNLLATSGTAEDLQVVEIAPEQSQTLQLPDCRDLRDEMRFYTS